MKHTKKITRNEFIKMLKDWKHGAQPVSLQYVTSPKLNKDGKNRFGDVTKIANVGGMVGYSYENSVNNQLEREQKEKDFVSQSLWNGKGKRISLALSTHIEKQTYYLTYKAQQTFKSFYFDTALNFIPVALLKPFFPVNNYKKQGVDKPVYHREISIANIRRFKFQKTTYELIPEMK